MTLEASFVLHLDRHWRILTKGDEPADAFAAACGDMIAARSMTIFAALFLPIVTRVKQENFTHHCLGKFFKGGRVAGFTNFGANVGGRGGLWRFGFSRPDDLKRNQQ